VSQEACSPNGEMLFAAQALKGAARVVGIRAAERLADGLELMLGAAESAAGVMSANQLQACADAMELLEAIAQAGAGRADELASAAQLGDLLVRLATPIAGGHNFPRKPRVIKAVPAATLNFCGRSVNCTPIRCPRACCRWRGSPTSPLCWTS